MTFTVQPRYLVLAGLLVLGLVLTANAMRMSNVGHFRPSCGDTVSDLSQRYYDEHGTYPSSQYMESIRQVGGCAR